MNTSLNCFRIDEETGNIETFSFTDYKVIVVSQYTQRKEIVFDGRLAGAKIKECCHLRYENLDKYVNHKVFSFNQSCENARKIVIESLKQKEQQLNKDLQRVTTLVNKMQHT